jgi:hypothetical protein
MSSPKNPIGPQVFVLFGRVLQLFETLSPECVQMRRLYEIPTLSENLNPVGEQERYKSAKTSRAHKSLPRQRAEGNRKSNSKAFVSHRPSVKFVLKSTQY